MQGGMVALKPFFYFLKTFIVVFVFPVSWKLEKFKSYFSDHAL